MTVTQIVSWLTLLTHIGVVILLFLLLFSKTRKIILSFIRKQGLLLSFLVAAAAVVLSLYYSEIAGYEPCRLCWIQRIFIYPQALLFGIALFRKEKQIFVYALPLTALGLLVSVYHVVIQLFPAYETCSATSASCTAAHFLYFGYITIPVMSLTAFLLLLIIGLIGLRKE